MKERNWLNRNTVAVIIIVYAVILLAFGLPFADRKVTGGLHIKEVYKETVLSQIVYTWEGIAVWVLLAGAVEWFCLGKYFDRLLAEPNTPNRARRVILLSRILGLAWIMAAVLYTVFTISHLYLAHFSQNAALREFARSKFVRGSAVVLVFIPAFVGWYKWRRSWRKFTADSVLAGYYYRECEKLQKANQHEAAELMLAKACDRISISEPVRFGDYGEPTAWVEEHRVYQLGQESFQYVISVDNQLRRKLGLAEKPIVDY